MVQIGFPMVSGKARFHSETNAHCNLLLGRYIAQPGMIIYATKGTVITIAIQIR